MTKAQYIARELALSILKAYHREIKSGFVSDASAVERERAQTAAFNEAERRLRAMKFDHTLDGDLSEESEKQ